MKFFKSKIFLIPTLVFILCLQLLSPLAKAESNSDGVQVINDAQKPWIVTFTKDIDFNTVVFNQSDLDTIFISDENNKHIPIDIQNGSSSKQYIVTPKNPYESKKVYTLHISNKIKSVNSKFLKEDKQKQFMFDADAISYTAAAKVTVIPNSLLKQVIVTSTTLPGASKYRVEQLGDPENIGDSSIAVIKSNTTRIYFYSDKGDILGIGNLIVSDSNDNLTFSVEE